MPNQDQLDALTETFRLFGADDPHSWALSELEEGIPQLTMYVFLKRGAELFGNDGLNRWLTSLAHEHAPEQGSAKHALSQITEKGISRDDMRQVLLAFYRDLLMEFCCLIDNTSSTHFDNDELNHRLANVNWRLFSVDNNGNPVAPMDALHEIVNDVTKLSDTCVAEE